MRPRLVLAFISIAILAACAPPSTRSVYGNPKLKRYETADAVGDCRLAIAHHDFRFLAVVGYALTVPGIDNFRSRYEHKYRYRVIDSTAEFPRDDKDERLHVVAAQYAKRYNLALLRYLESPQ